MGTTTGWLEQVGSAIAMLPMAPGACETGTREKQEQANLTAHSKLPF
jgi:hypothetical protein